MIVLVPNGIILHVYEVFVSSYFRLVCQRSKHVPL